jgi:hypothetical protein
VRTLPGGDVEVRNDLNEDFPDAVVTLTHARAGLLPNLGRTLSETPAAGGFRYRVTLPLPPHSVQTVHLGVPR